MKKKSTLLFIVAIVSITAATLTLAAIGIICAYSADFGRSNETETGTIYLPDHNSSEAADSTEDTFDSESSPPSDETCSDTHSSTADEEEHATTETEPPIIETEPEEIPSLEYESLGNGTCAVVGIGSITDSYVSIPEKSPSGDVVTEIKERAFFDNDLIKAVEIPSTVWIIGDLAFADCDELIYISVSEDSKAFTDIGGVLYSADLSKLIVYPSANAAPTISVSSSVEEISPMAFYGCYNLKTIYYSGSFEEWSEIKIGEMNYGLYTASILCSEE